MQIKDKHKIYAEQYVECSANGEGSWDVYLVIESVPENETEEKTSIKYLIANMDSMNDADLYAESLRYFYDKSIYKFDYN